MSDKIKTITDDNFKTEVLESGTPVLIDFWAEWCGPCKALTPILEDIAASFEGKVTIGKLNIDENPESPAQYGVMSIPSLILFKNGNVEASKVGLLSKSQLSAFIEGNL